jgi:hypothetical protein
LLKLSKIGNVETKKKLEMEIECEFGEWGDISKSNIAQRIVHNRRIGMPIRFFYFNIEIILTLKGLKRCAN